MFVKNSKNIKIDKNFSFFLSPTKQFDRATPKSLNKPSNTLYGHQRNATHSNQTRTDPTFAFNLRGCFSPAIIITAIVLQTL